MPLNENLVDLIHIGSGTLTLGDTTLSASTEGATLSVDRSIEFAEIDEVIGPAIAYLSGEQATLTINALELESALEVALDMDEDGSFGGGYLPEEYELTYEVDDGEGHANNVKIVLFRVVSASSVDSQFSRQNPTGVSLEFQALNDLSKDPGKRIGQITFVEETVE